MRTGVAYMGHHNPKYLDLDLREMKELQLDDVLLAAQENDFIYFPGKLEFTPKIAAEYGIRPIAIFWGVLNLFGGGRSSQFLLENPGRFPGVEGWVALPGGVLYEPAVPGADRGNDRYRCHARVRRVLRRRANAAARLLLPFLLRKI